MTQIDTAPKPAHPRRVDVFCRVIDNLGDLGVCWRLCRVLADRGMLVRLWADDTRPLAWMAPEPVRTGIEVFDWSCACDPDGLDAMPPADLWIEAFGCNLPEAFVAHAVRTRSHPPEWINLEYLSAEDWVLRMHGLPSPVMSGPAKGWTKRFVFPGFVPGTGGLLRETNLLERQAQFSASQWLGGLAASGLQVRPHSLKVSLFCYEPPALAEWLKALAHAADGDQAPVDFLLTPGRAAQAWASACRALGWQTLPPRIQAHALPWMSQLEFDHLLWSCDLNCVRGEDSLTRAIWAGKPLVWQLYPQEDAAHHLKLEAFTQTIKWPDHWAEFHRHWNGASPLAPTPQALQGLLRPESLQAVRQSVWRLRQSLLDRPALQDQWGPSP